MIFLDFFRKEKSKEEIERLKMEKTIVNGYKNISRVLINYGYKTDFSIDSLSEIDRFIQENSIKGYAKADGLLAEQTAEKLYTLGAYVGEVIRRKHGGKWIIELFEETKMDINIRLNNGHVFCPHNLVMKKLWNSEAYSIYDAASELNK